MHDGVHLSASSHQLNKLLHAEIELERALRNKTIRVKASPIDIVEHVDGYSRGLDVRGVYSQRPSAKAT